MALIVVDTSIFIDHLRGNDEARQALRAATLRGDDTVASVLTKVELLAGMRSHERASVRSLMGALAWIDLTEAVAEQAGALARRYARSHQGVEVVDFVIAATAQELNADLWTRNIRHFPMFRGLRAPY